MFVVVGLGNPGKGYKGTRHNIGFEVADLLAARHDTRIRRRNYQALTASIRVGRTEVLLIKPQTYMNASGLSVAGVCRNLTVDEGGLIVVHDDSDLEPGRIRVLRGGGSAGHKGIASIIEETGGSDFTRIRLGVGRPDVGALTDHVLDSFTKDEAEVIGAMTGRAADAVAAVVTEGLEAAMRTFNAAPADDNDNDRDTPA